MSENSRTPIFTPSPGRLCVIPLEEESRSGLLVVRNPNEKPVMGRVSEVNHEPDSLVWWSVQLGDTILFGSNSGLEIKVDGERRIILRESEVLAKVEWQEDAPLTGTMQCYHCGFAMPNGVCTNPECPTR